MKAQYSLLVTTIPSDSHTLTVSQYIENHYVIIKMTVGITDQNMEEREEREGWMKQ